MADIEKLFKKFVSEEITLSQKDISASAKSREWFLDRIKTKIQEKNTNGEAVPQLLADEPFVNFGSYFKGTKVNNVDEYDILVVLDSYNGQFTSNGTITGKGIGKESPCNKYNKKYKKSDDSGVSPSKLLNWLKGLITEIVEPLGGETPMRNGSAITATIKSKNLDIDFVPAGIFTSTMDRSRVFYNIPDGTDKNGWIITSPKEDIKLIKHLSQKHDGLKNIIRILKYIRSNYNFDISSFAIECASIEYTTQSWEELFSHNVFYSLKFLSAKLKEGKILDTWDNKNNLISHLDVNEWYAERIDKICEIILEIQNEGVEEKAYVKLCKSLKNQV